MAEIWTVQKILTWTITFFTSKHVPDARLSAELLLAHALNCRRIDLYLQFERILTPEERACFREYVTRRARREPVQYIIGETEFRGLPLRVSPAVLIPRPETELLVDSVWEWVQEMGNRSPVIVDIGTGSGCIAIALAHLLPEAQVWAVEKSSAALAVARENAQRHGVNIHFIEGDVFDRVEQLPRPAEVIVTNPPYVAGSEWETLEPEVRDYEPREALVGGPDGLNFYRRLAPVIGNWLGEGGRLFAEIGYGQARAVQEILTQAQLSVEIRRDYRQIERIVIARKSETVRDA